MQFQKSGRGRALEAKGNGGELEMSVETFVHYLAGQEPEGRWGLREM